MVKNKKRNAVVNFAALAAIQGGNALIPLVLLPYILIVIGQDKFALVVTVEAIAFIVLTVSLYSFDISGLQFAIKAAKKSRFEQGKVYYSIFWARLIILSVSSVVALSVCALFFGNKTDLLLAWLIFPLGVCLQSSYIYQARQNNIPLALFVVIPRMASVIVAVVLLESDSTALLVVLILSSSYLASGVISTLYLARTVEFFSPFALGWGPFIKIREGRALFIAGVSVILYRGSNTLLLGLMSAGPLSISYYAIAEKYVRMLQAISFPLSQVFSVRAIERLSGRGTTRSIPVLWDNAKYPILLAITTILALAIFGLIFSRFDMVAIPGDVLFLFFMMVWAVPFGIGNYIFGSIGLSVLQRERGYAVGVFMTGLMAVALSLILIPKYVEYGAAFSYFFAEVLLFVIVLSLLRREG